MATTVQTRFLIISDTHGVDLLENRPYERADVVLHCGDLTDGSKLDEFCTTLELLKSIDAPLKLVIAGNHDFSMDLAAFEAKVAEAVPALEPELVAREYGVPGQAQQLFEDAKSEGIVFLDEGTHHFSLGNGSTLTVYASPYTPSLGGAWGFQYQPDDGRHFDIQENTDIVMTHGPPQGVMDITYNRERAGCPELFAAIARTRPRLHCFGHIHEGWGAKLITWKDCWGADIPTHFTAIDNEHSPVIEKLAGLKKSRLDSTEMIETKKRKLEHLERTRCCKISQDDHSIQAGKQTLLINASITGSEEFVQRPFIVDIELSERYVAAA